MNALLKRAGYLGRAAKEGKREIKQLISEGKLERDASRMIRLTGQVEELEGRILEDLHGELYLLPSNPHAEPLQLRPEAHHRAQVGDLARVRVQPRKRRSPGKIEILAVKSETTRHLGVLRQVARAQYVELYRPYTLIDAQNRVRALREVPIQRTDAPRGAMVEVRLNPSPSGVEASLLQVLGMPGDRKTEITRLKIEHGLDQDFPEAVLREAEAFGEAPTAADIAGRRDLRHLALVTIDGITAKDFDDAVCAEREPEGRVRVFVAIADVSHYVRPGSPLDLEAERRGTSTYLTSEAIPMLPEALSNGLCSLNPGVDRLCLVAELLISRSGRVLETDFYPAVMRSKARITYEELAEALSGNIPEKLQPLFGGLMLLTQVAGRLLTRRLHRGAIDLDLPEPEVLLDDDGQVKDIIRRARSDAHRTIEDLMLAANEAVARHFLASEQPTVFRVHEEPNPLRLETLRGLTEALQLNFALPQSPAPSDFARLLERLSEMPGGKALHSLVLRSMAQAIYSGHCLGHFGLAASAYLHFTSPIRRYPDLIVHRMLKDRLAERPPRYTQEELDVIATQASEQERAAAKAERASMDLDRALLAIQHLGESSPARISGVAAFGLFCQLESPFVEGLLPVQQLGGDYFEIDEYGLQLTGEVTKRMFRLGDALEVVIAGVNLERRQVALALAHEAEDETRAGAETQRDRRRAEPGAGTSRRSRRPEAGGRRGGAGAGAGGGAGGKAKRPGPKTRGGAGARLAKRRMKKRKS